MGAIDPAGFDWQVRGLREDLVTALLRTLPKSLRRQIGAVGDHARAFLAEASPADGPLLDVLASTMARRTGERITPADLDLDRVPDHLRMTFRVVTERGRPLAWSKDLPALRTHLQDKLRATVTGTTSAVERDGLTSWTIGDLPRSIDTVVGGHTVTVHPALVDEGTSVAVRTFATPAEQRRAMWAGTRRLLLLTIGSPVPAVKRLLRNETKLALASAPYATAAEVLEDCATCALDTVLARAGGPVWDGVAFDRLRNAVRDDLVDTAVEVAVLAGRVIAHARRIERRLDEHTAAAVQPALTDIHVQVARLVHAGFVTATGYDRLHHLPRYLGAIDRRLDKLARDPHRDRALMARLAAAEQSFARLQSVRSGPEVAEVRWLLEELRVSVFAQSLGTPQPVSEQRVVKEIARLS
jgi:ATP-dependent helicase HrpA